MKRSRGFTLIELMVVLAVVGIIMAIAVPSYQNQVMKSRRAEAAQMLSDIALKQERYRANSATYGTLDQLKVSATIPSGYYKFATDTPTANCASGVAPTSKNSFRVTAEADGGQLSDSQCKTIVLTSLCGVVSKSSTPAGGRCW